MRETNPCPLCRRRENSEESLQNGHIMRFQCNYCSYAEIIFKKNEISPTKMVANGFMDEMRALKLFGPEVVSFYNKKRTEQKAIDPRRFVGQQ